MAKNDENNEEQTQKVNEENQNQEAPKEKEKDKGKEEPIDVSVIKGIKPKDEKKEDAAE